MRNGAKDYTACLMMHEYVNYNYTQKADKGCPAIQS
jgi:hypothetical protein